MDNSLIRSQAIKKNYFPLPHQNHNNTTTSRQKQKESVKAANKQTIKVCQAKRGFFNLTETQTFGSFVMKLKRKEAKVLDSVLLSHEWVKTV